MEYSEPEIDWMVKEAENDSVRRLLDGGNAAIAVDYRLIDNALLKELQPFMERIQHQVQGRWSSRVREEQMNFRKLLEELYLPTRVTTTGRWIMSWNSDVLISLRSLFAPINDLSPNRQDMENSGLTAKGWT